MIFSARIADQCSLGASRYPGATFSRILGYSLCCGEVALSLLKLTLSATGLFVLLTAHCKAILPQAALNPGQDRRRWCKK